jgi:ubiquinone/menaquinone biosynthesis C-methylase UbiE
LAATEASKEGKTYNILDLAAGSGLFTKVLHTHLADTCNNTSEELVQVCAVEPAAGMRRVFSLELPDVPIFNGTSTSLPFPDNHFDLVTVAQAFHWFANHQTLAEIHRVLKTDGQGTLALIWNLESTEIEWMKRLRALYEPYDANVPQYRKGEWEQAFVSDEEKPCLFELPIMKKTFQTEMLVTQADMMSRVESKSYITALSDGELRRLKEKMRHLLYNEYGRDFCITADREDCKGDLCARHLLDVELVLTKTSRQQQSK